jgi:hypothetical protein
MFGKALVEPVDDIQSGADVPPVLDLLADDFEKHAYDLRRLIRLIAATEVYRLDSRADPDSLTDSDRPNELTDAHAEAWAAFPMTRLRPEQVVGSLLQSCSLSTIGYQSHILVRIARQTGQNDFVTSYGDAGEEELAQQGGTVPQRLLMMNGDLVKDKTQQALLTNAATQIALLAPNDEKAVEIAYLAILTRRPTDDEAAFFTTDSAGAPQRSRNQRLEDLYWTLFNSTEFAWNH